MAGADSEGRLVGVAAELRALVSRARRELEGIDAERVRRPLRSGGWSPVQELGHLVDSAIVNQQRLVRARLEKDLLVEAYNQDGWVETQRMEKREWSDVVALWAALNHHLAHLIEQTPQEEAARPCRLAGGDAVTLGFLARDYVAHQRHHLRAILGG